MSGLRASKVPFDKDKGVSFCEETLLIRPGNQGRVDIRFMLIWQSSYYKRTRNTKRIRPATQSSRSLRIASIRFPNTESVAENDFLSGRSSFTLI